MQRVLHHSLLLAPILLPVLASLGLSAPARYGRPNIILLMADDMGWGDTHYNGNPDILTPNLDSMAAAGVEFRRFHAQSAVCSPTRGSVLTGRHPDRYGILDANVGRLEAGEITLAEVLKTQGYATGHFGKWHLGTLNHDADFPDGRRGGDRSGARGDYSPPWENGFDVCFSSEVQLPTWDPMQDQNFPSKYWTGPGKYATDNLQGDDARVIMDRALPFLESAARSQTPFFAVIWFHTPHKPYVAGPEFLARYAGRGLSEDARHYFGSITAMDEQIGRLRARLRELGLANTFLAFTSDNGPENGTPGSNGGLRGRKHEYHEGGIRVPGLVEWPAVIKEHLLSDYLAASTDYFPTILDILDLEIASGQPRPVDGVSFLDALLGHTQIRPRPLAFSRKGSWEALIDGYWKLVRKDEADPWQLYNLLADEKETTDLAGKPGRKELVDSLARIYVTWEGGLKKETDYPKEPLRVNVPVSILPRPARSRPFPTFQEVYNAMGRKLKEIR